MAPTTHSFTLAGDGQEVLLTKPSVNTPCVPSLTLNKLVLKKQKTARLRGKDIITSLDTFITVANYLNLSEKPKYILNIF